MKEGEVPVTAFDKHDQPRAHELAHSPRQEGSKAPLREGAGLDAGTAASRNLR